MQKFNTQGIVLGRTNYGEAGRIITFLTPDHGKVKVMAKGVRKAKSKLAGGIELFSVSDIGVMKGRGEIDTLVSSRLLKHFGNIVKDLTRTAAAYAFIKQVDKGTADHPETAYFELLQKAFEALDNQALEPELVQLWFRAQMIKLAGHIPNLDTQKDGSRLVDGKRYRFDNDSMSFVLAQGGGKAFTPNDIKFLRLLFAHGSPERLQKIDGLQSFLSYCAPLLQSL